MAAWESELASRAGVAAFVHQRLAVSPALKTPPSWHSTMMSPGAKLMAPGKGRLSAVDADAQPVASSLVCACPSARTW